MALTVRGLLPKVQVFRKDLETDRSIFAIQEAVRKICRQTMLARETLLNVTASSNILQLYPSTGNAVNRVHKVEIQDYAGLWNTINEYNQKQIDRDYSYPDLPVGIPNGWSYVGNGQIHLYPTPNAFPLANVVVGNKYSILTLGTTVFATYGATTVNATALVVGTEYVVLVPGTTDFTLVGASASAAGTIFIATGVGIGSGTTLKRVFTATGIPTGTGTLGQLFRVEISEVPTSEIDTIPLPDEAEDCIVAGALATILAIPGMAQDKTYSKDREILHNRELGNLKAVAVFGQSGRMRVQGQILGGRQGSFFSYGSRF